MSVRSMMGWILVAGLVSAWPAGAAESPGQEQEYSQANRLLFMTDHLSNVPHHSALEYEFERKGTLESPFRDTVAVRVAAQGSAGGKQAQIELFTGERKRAFPPVDDARGNPVLLAFLQHDVAEMQRFTDGSWRHFQRLIKFALEGGAVVEAVTIAYDGHDLDAVQISIRPFLQDPQRARYSDFDRKYYVFTLSEAVPGWIYQLRSVVPPSEAEEAMPLLEETLTLRGVRGGTDG
jgi:hypothetical protein